MVSEFEVRDDKSAVTALEVSHDNYFILPDGTMAETGLIEHLAQSCSTLAGCLAASSNVEMERPPIGLIGEVKHFECHRRPRVGEKVKSIVTFGMTFGNVTLATGQTFVDEAGEPHSEDQAGEPIADIQLKIFMQ